MRLLCNTMTIDELGASWKINLESGAEVTSTKYHVFLGIPIEYHGTPYKLHMENPYSGFPQGTLKVDINFCRLKTQKNALGKDGQ